MANIQEPVPVPDAEHNLEIQVLARWAILEHNLENLSIVPPVSTGVKYVKVLKATKQDLVRAIVFRITLEGVSRTIIGPVGPVGIIPPIEIGKYEAEIGAEPLENKLELINFIPLVEKPIAK